MSDFLKLLKYRSVIFLLLTVIFSTNIKSQDFLVKDGVPQAEIIIAQNSTRTQMLAAGELQIYIEKISGAKLPVSMRKTEDFPMHVYVGKSQYTDEMNLDNSGLKYGAYQMVSGEDFFVLMGRDTDAERGKGGKGIYPVSRGDRKRAEEVWNNKVHGRWPNPFVSSFKGYNKELDLSMVDEWGSLNAVNDFLRSLGVEWYMPGDIGEVLPAKMDNIEVPANINKIVRPEVPVRKIGFYYNAFFMASEEETLWQMRLGLYNKGGMGSHGIIKVLNSDKMRERHPEYYSLIGGKRQLKARGGKPCLSSEGLRKETLAYARYMFDNYDKQQFSAMPTDAYNGCQCPLCKGKATPERGRPGTWSDYVWGFVNDIAKELYKTHPDRKVSCYAYAGYLLPPLKIKKLSPNVVVGICQWRHNFYKKDVKEKYLKIRNEWLQKLTSSSSIGIWEYYLHGRGDKRFPVFAVDLIKDDLRDLKSKLYCEGIETYRTFSSGRNKEPDPILSTKHLDIFVTHRLWWNPDLDVPALMDRYYKGFWGPMASEAKAFIEFSEKNWMDMSRDAKKCRKALDLLDAMEAVNVPEDSRYAQRVKLLEDYLSPMRDLCATLEKDRTGNPWFEINIYRGNTSDIVLDGKLDEGFWKNKRTARLKEMRTGRPPYLNTSFIPIWAEGTFYLAITCQEQQTSKLRIMGENNDDPEILKGDVVHFLLETQGHSYYHIAVNPKGLVFDEDIVNGKHNVNWESNVKVATNIGDSFWTVEMEFPVKNDLDADINPESGVAGRIPSMSYPWYINIGRERPREFETQKYSWSPTGKDTIFDDMRFGKTGR